MERLPPFLPSSILIEHNEHWRLLHSTANGPRDAQGPLQGGIPMAVHMPVALLRRVSVRNSVEMVRN